MTAGAGRHGPIRERGAVLGALLAATLLACFLAACDRAEAGSGLPDTLRAGYSEEPPYAYLDGEGRVTGESPEVLRVVAEELGIENVQWVRMDFDELIPSLLEGRIDVVSSGLFVTPARSGEVRFSLATVCTRPALVVRAEEEADRAPEASAPDTRIAVMAGSVEADAARNLGFPPERVLTVYDLLTGIAAVRSGEADALAVTLPTAQRIVEGDSAGDLRVLGPYEPPPGAESVAGCSALAFRPSDEALAAAADCVLDDLVGSDRHLELIAPFGFDRAALPPDLDGSGRRPDAAACPETR